MWLYVLVPIVLAALFYAYTIRDSIKIAPPKGGCNSCPKKQESFQNL
jgi:hypothetical protein